MLNCDKTQTHTIYLFCSINWTDREDIYFVAPKSSSYSPYSPYSCPPDPDADYAPGVSKIEDPTDETVKFYMQDTGELYVSSNTYNIHLHFIDCDTVSHIQY